MPIAQFLFKPVLAFIAATSLCAGLAHAQTAPYPNKPVNLIAPFPPGGVVDQTGRAIAQSLFKVWQQPVVINTRAGAGGGVGMAAAASAPAAKGEAKKADTKSEKAGDKKAEATKK